jgi:hypothetical protein
MSDRRMLFSPPMVRAILAGRKTQTRRLAKPRRRNSLFALEDDGSPMWGDSFILDPGNAAWLEEEKPMRAGDRIIGCEAYRFDEKWDKTKPSEVPPTDGDGDTPVLYDVDPLPAWAEGIAGKLRPSMFMVPWASRLRLPVTEVRLERLHAITAADAIAEGLLWRPAPIEAWSALDHPSWPTFTDPVRSYEGLWKHINGGESWEANLLVWVFTFSNPFARSRSSSLAPTTASKASIQAGSPS